MSTLLGSFLRVKCTVYSGKHKNLMHKMMNVSKETEKNKKQLSKKLSALRT